mgnify:CR=1 FL=1
MQRRTFLKNALSACAATGAVLTAPSMLKAASANNQGPNWSLGWQSVELDSFAPLAMSTSGFIPPDIQGMLLRNGPAKMQRADKHYRHWFDGDGMVQQFSFKNGQVAHQAKFVQTEKYQKEEAEGEFLYGGAGTVFKDSLPTSNNDSINTANTALLHWDNELLALWEGGSAYAMDAQSLATKGLKTWRRDMKHMPFSAHPLIDASNGSMWNFGFAPYAGKGMLFVYHILPKVGVNKVEAIPLPISGYMHDFAQTKEHLIFLVPPYHYANNGGKNYVDRFVWQPELGSRLLVVSKNDLSQQQWFELPAGFVFHFGHATQQKQEISVNVSWYETPSLMAEGMTELMSTGQTKGDEHAVAATIIANLNTKQCSLVKSKLALEFPGFDEQNLQADSSIIGVGRKTRENRFTSGTRMRHSDTLVSYQPESGKHKEYVYDYGTFAEEPLSIKGEKTDYIVQTYLDVIKHKSGINIFSRDHIDAGPIGQASMDRLIPLGFHGTFIA